MKLFTLIENTEFLSLMEKRSMHYRLLFLLQTGIIFILMTLLLTALPRGAQSAEMSLQSDERFIDNGDGTISDLNLNLMWTKSDNGEALIWPDAYNYCNDLTLAGYDDWHLPTIAEMRSLYDKDISVEPSCNLDWTNHLPEVFKLSCCCFWSARYYQKKGTYFNFANGESLAVSVFHSFERIMAVRFISPPQKIAVDFMAGEGFQRLLHRDLVFLVKENNAALMSHNTMRLNLPKGSSGDFTISVWIEKMPIQLLGTLKVDGKEIADAEVSNQHISIRGNFALKGNGTTPKTVFAFKRKRVLRNLTARPIINEKIKFLVYSAGLKSGNYSMLNYWGKEFKPNKRGYNLVALTQENPPRYELKNFDTCGSPEANDHLANWIDSLPENTLVLGAVQDDASSSFSQKSFHALRKLGCKFNASNHFRWSHSFLGRKGIAPGQAVESYGPGVSSISNMGIMVPIRKIEIIFD